MLSIKIKTTSSYFYEVVESSVLINFRECLGHLAHPKRTCTYSFKLFIGKSSEHLSPGVTSR